MKKLVLCKTFEIMDMIKVFNGISKPLRLNLKCPIYTESMPDVLSNITEGNLL